jgi:hypothetical protein
LGEGGFAAVYKAKWNGTNIAVKQMKADLSYDVIESFEGSLHLN